MRPRPSMSTFVFALAALVALVGHACGGDAAADPDACAESPCQHGGVCVEVADTARCDCVGPWTGPYCNVSNGCGAQPCGDGSCRDNGAGGYSCSCPAGAYDDGTTCRTCVPIDGCAAVRCTDGDDHVCSACREGWVMQGVGCRELDGCAGAPCGVGTCVDLGLGQHRCDCPGGFYDDKGGCAACGTLRDCAEVACTSNSDTACVVCSDGFDLADGACVDADDCATKPCGAGGCTDLGLGDYACDCDAGHYNDGTTCPPCGAVADCLRATCTDAHDARCVECPAGWLITDEGGCAPNACDDLPLTPGVPATGDTRGRGDADAGCTLGLSDGSTFVAGEGAEDEIWSFTLATLAHVTLTVEGFDAALYLRSGQSCSSARALDDACVDVEAGDSETFEGVLDAGRYWAIVDGFDDGSGLGATAGAYTITLALDSPCDAGEYPGATSCRPCPAVAGCDAWTCTNASDGVCTTCARGYADDGAGGCAPMPCDKVLVDGAQTGSTLGAGDHSVGCAGTLADGTPFVLGAGAPDETWSLVLTERTRVTIDVDGFDAAVYVLEGPTCLGAGVLDNGCADAESGAHEQWSGVLDAGQHWVVVDGFGDGVQGSAGDYTLTLARTLPCDGIPASGVCAGEDVVKWCIVPPAGIGVDAIATSVCGDGEVCREIDGSARCYPEPTAETCAAAMAFCDGDTLVWCDAPGPFNRTACADGCVDRQQGAYCATPDLAREPYEATVSYEYKVPNADLSDWDPTPRVAPLKRAIVYSFKKVGDAYELVDSAVTDDAGHFALDVASPPSPDDVVAVYAAKNKPLSSEWGFVVAEPAVGDGLQPIDAVSEGLVHGWNLPANDSGQAWLVTEDIGSAAARVFDVMSVVYENTAELYYRDLDPASVVVWLRLGTTWDCGECLWNAPTSALGFEVANQLFVRGDAEDAGYWADAVTLHEAGHWTMSAFGTPPGEGGPHYFGVAYYPGLAWSEGWAMWLACDWLGTSRYLDKQQGTMFWIDVALRQMSLPEAWPLPVPSDGVLGRLYEGEVAAMLWGLSNDPAVTANALYRGLAAPRAQLALRGYTRKTWSVDEVTGEPSDVVDSGEPTVTLADFFDALVCAAEPADIAAHVDAVTAPAERYAYPSAAPICAEGTPGGAPAAPTSGARLPRKTPAGSDAGHAGHASERPPFVLEVRAATKGETTILEADVVRAPVSGGGPFELALDVPAQARLVAGKARERVIDGDDGDGADGANGAAALTRRWVLEGAGEATLTASWASAAPGAWGARARRVVTLGAAADGAPRPTTTK